MNGCPRDHLLIFNPKEGWGPLCAFLGQKDIPNCPFPEMNSKQDPYILRFKKGKYVYDAGLSYKIRCEMRNRLAIIVLGLSLLISLFLNACF